MRVTLDRGMRLRKGRVPVPGRHRSASRRVVSALCASLVVTAGCASARAPSIRSPASVDPRAWAAQVLARMSLEQKVGQLILPALPADFAAASAGELRTIQRLVQELGLGGFLVPGGPPLERAARLNFLQQGAAVPLLMAAAYPGEGVGETGGVTRFPGNMGLAATGQPLRAELAARVIAREVHAQGIGLLLGPHVVPAAPGRPAPAAFSDDAATVARFAEAVNRGARSARVLPALRAFSDGRNPGVERRDLAALETLLRGGAVGAVMLGNGLAPTLTGDSITPAALSAAIATRLLRGELGFGGLIVSDRLDDPALRDVPGYHPAEFVVRALEAGADVLLAPADPASAHRAVVAAVRSGRLPYNRIDDSVRRILLAKAATGAIEERAASLDSVLAVVAAPEHRSVAAEIAAQSLVLARDSAVLLPLDPRHVRTIATLAVAPTDDPAAGAALAAAMRATYGSGTSFERLEPRTADAIVDAAVARAGLAEAVVLGIFDAVTGEDTRRVHELAARVRQRLATVNHRLVVVSFGDPLPGAALPASTYLLAWQPRGEIAQQAVARALAGQAEITGVLPRALPGSAAGLRRSPRAGGLRPGRAAEVGMDSAALDRLDNILLSAIHNGASPGAAIAVGRHGRIVKLRGYGRIDHRQSYADVTDSTIYDLASLTKVVATTSAIAVLVERGLLSLDDPVGHYIPEWNTTAAKRAVTLRNLLLHNSGLAAYAPLYQQLRGRADYRHRIARMDLEYAPGTRTVYSDFGAILLGLIAEQVTGETLDVFLQRELFEPLGMRDTGYNPLAWPNARIDLLAGSADDARFSFVLERIAPTEVDTLFRDRQVHGRVHDENADAIGGVAGHAGLFSSARDLAVFAQLMLDQGYYGGERLLDPATIEAFTHRASAESSRALGWDTPAGQSSAGDYFSSRSFGHTGFTGTSIWIDPERDLFVVLLTNRVNPTRANQKHVPLRRAIADAVQLAIRDVAVERREQIELGTF